MPIFYRYPRRILFSHIPKTAGSSIYIWFAKNNYLVSNLLLRPIGVGIAFRQEFNISSLQVEGEQDTRVSPQHVVSETWLKWGQFDDKFAIVRCPFGRYESEVKFQFSAACDMQKRNPLPEHFEIFRRDFLSSIKKFYPEDNCKFDNHIRPQIEFLDEETRIYRFEENWIAAIAQDFSLAGAPPHEKKSDASLGFELNANEINFIQEFYSKDFENLGYSADYSTCSMRNYLRSKHKQ